MDFTKLLPGACAAALLLTGRAGAGTLLTPAWALAPAAGLDFLTTGNTERGIAFNPVSKNLILATRSSGLRMAVIDPVNGEKQFEMSTAGVVTSANSGIALNMVGVADDGAVYACNVVSASTANPLGTSALFRIYRWASDAPDLPGAENPPTVAFAGDPSGLNATGGSNFPNRWGDTIAVRGAGTNTQILVGSGATAACLFTTTDGLTFTPQFLNNALEAGGCKGIAFGAGDTFYSKANGATKKLRRSSFDPATFATTVLNDYTVTASTGVQIVPIALDLAANQWATFETGGSGPEMVKIFDISSLSASPVLLNTQTLPTDNTNTNAVGSAAIGEGKLFICDTNNGLVAYNIEVTADIVPPAVTASPPARSAYTRGQTTFSVTAAGTPPLAYQWFRGDTAIQNATTPEYTVNPVTAESAGLYKCRVTNAAPAAAESVPAELTVVPSADTAALTVNWQLSAGSRPWLTNGDTERGMDCNAAADRLYVVSRTPKSIHILAATDGSHLGELLTTGVDNASGGNAGFELNMVGTGGDGAIYACNLSSTGAATLGAGFKLYQWPNDAPETTPAVVYDGNPASARLGDSMDVRGSGTDTQIVCGTRSTNQFVLFRPNDVGFFTPTVITIDGAPAGAFGLSIAFGSGNTVWGKTTGNGLVLASFDPAAGTGALVTSYSTAVFPADVAVTAIDPASGLLAGIQLGNSDNVRLYGMPVPFPDPAPAGFDLYDQEFFTTDNPNVNGVGSIAFGGGRVFALNTNNGLACFTAVRPAVVVPPVITNIVRSGANVVFTLRGTPGTTYLIEKSTQLNPAAAWTADGTVTPAAAEETVTRAIVPGTPRVFYRARPQ